MTVGGRSVLDAQAANGRRPAWEAVSRRRPRTGPSSPRSAGAIPPDRGTQQPQVVEDEDVAVIVATRGHGMGPVDPPERTAHLLLEGLAQFQRRDRIVVARSALGVPGEVGQPDPVQQVVPHVVEVGGALLLQVDDVGRAPPRTRVDLVPRLPHWGDGGCRGRVLDEPDALGKAGPLVQQERGSIRTAPGQVIVEGTSLQCAHEPALGTSCDGTATTVDSAAGPTRRLPSTTGLPSACRTRRS